MTIENSKSEGIPGVEIEKGEMCPRCRGKGQIDDGHPTLTIVFDGVNVEVSGCIGNSLLSKGMLTEAISVVDKWNDQMRQKAAAEAEGGRGRKDEGRRIVLPNMVLPGRMGRS